MSYNIERAVFTWLQDCPVSREIFCVAGRVNGTGVDFVPEGDVEVCRYLRGSERQFHFSLRRCGHFAQSPNDETNLTAFENVRAIAAWIEEQDAAGNLPRLPDGCSAAGLTVEGIVGAGFNNGSFACVVLDVLLDYFKEE